MLFITLNPGLSTNVKSGPSPNHGPLLNVVKCVCDFSPWPTLLLSNLFTVTWLVGAYLERNASLFRPRVLHRVVNSEQSVAQRRLPYALLAQHHEPRSGQSAWLTTVGGGRGGGGGWQCRRGSGGGH